MAKSQDMVINGKSLDLSIDIDNDPVAANLVKVVNILNKHHLADGLDLHHLKDSIGFEQGTNKRKLTMPSGVKGIGQQNRLGLPDVKVAGNPRLSGRRERTVVDDCDGSYLGITKNSSSIPERKQLEVGIDKTGSSSGRLDTEQITQAESQVRHSAGISPSDSGWGSSQTSMEPGNATTCARLTTTNNPKFPAPNHRSNTQRIPLASTKDSQSTSQCLCLSNGQSTTTSSNVIRTVSGQLTDNVNSAKSTMVTGCHGNRVLVDVDANDMDLVTDMVDNVRGCCHGDKVGTNPDRMEGKFTTAMKNGKAGVEDFKVFYWKIEVEEWSRINRLLRQHGLPPVDVLHPKRAATLSDTVVLEPEMARTLRQTLQTLMKDCDRRQGLVQELIITNNHLRDHTETPGDNNKRNELSEQTSTTERYETRARDLKVQLDSSRSKVEDLEEDRLVRSGGCSEEERLRNTKNAIQARCRELQEKVEDQQLEIDTLRAQLNHAKEQDQSLKRRHEEALLKLKKQAPKNARIDDKTLDVIDSYERQIYSLQCQLELRDNTSTDNPVSQEATPNYKALIKSYERDIRDSRKKTRELENDNQLLRIDLQSRPEMKDFRAGQQRVKKLERILREHNIRFDGKGQTEHLAYSSRVEDLDFLPLAQCQQHLRHICEQLGTEDVEQVNATLRKQQRALEAQPKMEEFAQKVLVLANTSGVPVPPEFANRHKPHSSHEVWCEKTWHHVIPTLEHWVTQLKALKDLQTELVKLTAMLSPSGVTGLDADPPSVTKMITAIRSLHSDDNRHQSGNHGNKDAVSRAVLQGIVDHFMTLFDVTKISGVYARMNDVYTKLGEVHNTMTTLRSLLGLPSDARGSAVVDATARLCQTHNKATSDQLRELLNVDDLNSVVRMLEEHREFFPVFQEIMSNLMEICGCHRLDQVVPTVRALKMLAG